MKKSKKNDKTTSINVKIETREDFFARGKRIAKMLDEGKRLDPSRIISFEDPSDLVQFLTKMKLSLLAALRKQPDSRFMGNYGPRPHTEFKAEKGIKSCGSASS